jgi:hypothetical protein
LDRFVSFLVIPVLGLLAAGLVEITSYTRSSVWARRASFAAVLFLGLILLSRSIPALESRTTISAEAFKEVGVLVNEFDGAVLTNSRRPLGLDYYIDRPVEVLSPEELEGQMCSLGQEPIIVVDHPLLQERPLDTSCLVELGLDLVRFRQLTRGGRIDVWVGGG